MSQIDYLKLLITRSILSGPLDFEIKRVTCIYMFMYLTYFLSLCPFIVPKPDFLYKTASLHLGGDISFHCRKQILVLTYHFLEDAHIKCTLLLSLYFYLPSLQDSEQNLHSKLSQLVAVSILGTMAAMISETTHNAPVSQNATEPLSNSSSRNMREMICDFAKDMKLNLHFSKPVE